ncbi:MAG: hypothetical protein GXO37_02220, partial [Chloroflexi bacterium]|nr:hypothetical protein [Chloroflexota bacterium]
MNMLLWLWIIALLAAGGMTALAVVRPRLKAAWWLALATALLMTLLWAAAYPSTPRVLVWPGVWSPVLSPPGSHLSPWTWAAGLALLTASWAGLARSAYPLPTASVTDPRPWSAWLLLTVGSLTALTATQGWATALAWAAVDAAVLGVELQGHATNRARRAAWQRTAVRALFWAVPLAAPRLEPSQAGLVWAGAMLLRAWASPRQGDPARSAFAPAGRWLFWMPWAVTLVPWLHAPAGDLSSPARLAIAGVGLVAAVRALRTLDPAVRRRGWTTTATALVMLAAQHDPQGAQAWWLLLFVAGLSLEGLMRIPDPWLSGGLAVLLVGPALLWPFTPGAAVLASWPWPPSAETGALALLYALLLALAWRHWPRGPETLATAPRGSQILVATGLFALPAALWGAGLRLGWFTPPAQSPGWLPWGVGPALFGLAFALERIPWLRAARQDRAP